MKIAHLGEKGRCVRFGENQRWWVPSIAAIFALLLAVPATAGSLDWSIGAFDLGMAVTSESKASFDGYDQGVRDGATVYERDDSDVGAQHILNWRVEAGIEGLRGTGIDAPRVFRIERRTYAWAALEVDALMDDAVERYGGEPTCVEVRTVTGKIATAAHNLAVRARAGDGPFRFAPQWGHMRDETETQKGQRCMWGEFSDDFDCEGRCLTVTATEPAGPMGLVKFVEIAVDTRLERLQRRAGHAQSRQVIRDKLSQ
ncbi:MAG: hypothetical protein RJQ08_10550 [Salinisphaeraceae bacterium]